MPTVLRRKAAALLLCATAWPALTACSSTPRDPVDVDAVVAAFSARTLDAPGEAPRDAAGAAASGFDLRDGLSCDEAEAVAVIFNGDLRVARLRAGVARAEAATAGAWADPVIGIDFTRIVEDVAHPWKSAITAGLTLPLLGRTDAAKDAANARVAAETAGIAGREWTVRMDVRRAFADRAAAEQEIAELRDLVARTDALLEVVGRLDAGGEIARAEARILRADAAVRRSELRQAEFERDETLLRIRRLVGLPPGAALTLSAAAFPARRTSGDVAPATTPAVAAALAEYEAAEARLALAEAEIIPGIGVSGGHGREDASDETSGGLSVPIPLFDGNSQAIAAAKASRAAARGAVELAVESAMADAAAARLRLARAEEEVRTIERDLLPAADANQEEALRLARLGEVDAFVLFETLAHRHDVRERWIRARHAAALAGIAVDEIAGPGPSAGASAEGVK